ncbi:MAG: SDR family NAD(P)-dependent oxidoreductase [Bacteroidetes bacterium]|nr:SDR family NAD(P)-dependent oxidoreductase [Bacteroidota bacterium]
MASRNVLITGVTGNLGKAVARKFKEEGDKVFGVSHSDPPSTIDLDGCFRINLTNAKETSLAWEEIFKLIDRVDVLVSTVGGFAPSTVAGLKEEDISTMFSLNFFSTVNFVIPAFRKMISQKAGRIFLIGAKAGISAEARKAAVAYGLSKAALFNFAESLNWEGEKQGVVTSVVVPSIIDTPQNRESMPGADYSTWVSADQIASVIFYHASEEARLLRQPVIKAYGNV